MPLPPTIDYQPIFEQHSPVSPFCDLALDQRDCYWFVCAVRACGFGVLYDNANFDPPAAVKVHFKAKHLPINYRK